MEQTSTVGWKAPVPLAGVVIALRSADKRGPSGPRLSWANAPMLTDGKQGCRVTVMERTDLVEMLKDAGHPDLADLAERAAGVTPEDEARFDEWLADPANKARWDEALERARG